MAFVVNELLITSSKVRDLYQLVCNFGDIFLCEIFSHVFHSIPSSSVLQSIDQQQFEDGEKGATYPSGLDLIYIQRQEKLRYSFKMNPIFSQLEVSHSNLETQK